MIQTINNNQHYGMNRNESNGGNEVKKIISLLLSKWYWFLIAVAIAITAAVYYIKITPPLYEVRSTILLDNTNAVTPLTALYGPGSSFQQGNLDYSSMYNQIAILTSTPIVTRTISELDFEISYYEVGQFATTEMYKDVPFQILWDENHPQIVEGAFFLTLHPDNSITVSLEGEDVIVHNYSNPGADTFISEYSFQTKIKPDTEVKTKEFSFIITMNENFSGNENGTYMFKFHTVHSVVTKYRSMLLVEVGTDYSSILNLSVKDYNIQKGMDFLTRLSQVYQDHNLEQKNKNANLTIHFIDSQLQNIADSLNISEDRLESFRRNNQMIDFSSQSQQLLTEMNILDQEILRHQAQNKYYKYLKDYIESNQNIESVIAPSAMGIEDPLLNSFIIQLNDLVNQKTSQTSIRPNSDHPAFVQLNTQIEIVKNSLRQSINNIITQSDIELENLNQRMSALNGKIRRLPSTERNFVNFERKYRIDSETYTFLLQKLSEARIAQASNLPDGQMLEAPFLGLMVHPLTSRTYSLALILGLVFPATVILLRNALNNRILSEDDIKSFTSLPVIGNVLQNDNKAKSSTPVMDMPNSPISNIYASVRTKLNLLTKAKSNPVIAITSAIPQEGKSFSSINIASSFALAQKSVVLLDLDIRNSKITEYLNLSANKGVVNYIIGQADLGDIICNTKLPRLKVIPAGPIPPNPTELLSDDKIVELVTELKNNFDVVIIDLPPIAFISDIYHIQHLIDSNLLIIRYKYTPKNVLKEVLTEIKDFQMKGVGLVFNGIPKKKGKHGYGYGYGYGYEYYASNGKGKSANKKLKHKREFLAVEEPDSVS